MRPSRFHAEAPATPTRIERAAQILAVAACVFFALVAAWEVGAPVAGGHWAAMAASAIAGENMLRYHIFGAVANYVSLPPVPEQYYCHHPYGIFILEALAHRLFGHHSGTIRVPAIVCSALSAPLVFKLAQAIWKDAVVAAVATVAFVFVPIDLSFACFSALEVPTIFFGLLFSWATVRLWETWLTRYLLLAIVGAFGTASSDWIGIVFVGAVAGLSFFRVYVLPRRFHRRLDERAHALWFAYATVAAAGSLVLYITLFTKAEHIGDLLGAYHSRSVGSEATLKEVFGERRHMWFSWMVTPLGAGIVAGALPLSVARLFRGPGEFIPLAWTFMATFQYLLFKTVADIHIFWPHYYGVCVALGAGVFTATMLGARRWVSEHLPPRAKAPFLIATGAILAVVVATPILLLARMALPQLRQGRLTSGRFDDGGRFIEPETDATQFTEWAVSGLPPDAMFARTPSFIWASHVEYASHRVGQLVSADPGSRGPGDVDRVMVVDARRAAVADLHAIASKYGVVAVGPFWRVDRAAGQGFRALRYTEREPGLLEWYFITGTDLVRTIGPDDDQWATWDWLDSLKIDVASPSAAPGTFDELRTAHNVALARGDTAAAAALRSRTLAFMHDKTPVDFSGDVHLVGTNIEYGAVTVLTLLWEAGEGYKPIDTSFYVKCKVIAKPPLWMADIDFFEKDMAPPMAFGPRLWKPGYLYVERIPIRHRIGTETCEGMFDSAMVIPLGGADRLHLLTLR